MPADESRVKWGTIQQELDSLVGEDALDRAVFLFHTPPYDTPLDRAALDGEILMSMLHSTCMRVVLQSDDSSKDGNPYSRCMVMFTMLPAYG